MCHVAFIKGDNEMLMYAKGDYKISVMSMTNECVFVKEFGSNVEVSRGTKEDMKCLFNSWVKRLRSASSI